MLDVLEVNARHVMDLSSSKNEKMMLRSFDDLTTTGTNEVLDPMSDVNLKATLDKEYVLHL